MSEHFLGLAKWLEAPIRGGRPPMSPLQEQERGHPNILVVYITKILGHPGALFLSSYGGLSGGLWPHPGASSPFSGPIVSPDI